MKAAINTLFSSSYPCSPAPPPSTSHTLPPCNPLLQPPVFTPPRSTSSTANKPSNMPFISDKSVQPLSLTQLKGLAALVAPDPITHGDITAQLIVKGETGLPGDAEGDVGDDIKYRLSIPTRWCPPVHDDDGFLCEDINPFDRILLLPPVSGSGATATPGSEINLLDMVQPTPTHQLAENGGRKVIILPRRVPVTPAGSKLLFRLGGDVLPFTKMSARRNWVRCLV